MQRWATSVITAGALFALAMTCAACGANKSSDSSIGSLADNGDGGSLDASVPSDTNGRGGHQSVGGGGGPGDDPGGGGLVLDPGELHCTPKTCAAYPVGTCGRQSDGCGGLTPDCSPCMPPQTCGGGGTPSQCGGASGCIPKTKAQACDTTGYDCGFQSDGCGGTVKCGDCTSADTCGGGGQQNKCGHPTCTPLSLAVACANKTCGFAPDGCGDAVACGSPEGACPAGQTCGANGHADQCGVPAGTDAGADGGGDGTPSCTPLPKADACGAKNCGPAADGCGNTLDCGVCTAPQTCGGGGTPSVCGGAAGCVPKTKAQACDALHLDCGFVSDGCGGALACGSCSAGQSCGIGGPNVCGAVTTCTPHTCGQASANCGQVADGCGGLTPVCGTCSAGDICGGGGAPNQCGHAADAGASQCANLCLSQVQCPGPGTTVTGRIVSPALSNPDPVYNATVYVPNSVNGQVDPFPAQLTCDQCNGAMLSGSPLVKATTSYDGTFTLTNVPAAVDFPVVVQIGRWRRKVTISARAACTTTSIGDIRLPRNAGEGDIPRMAISTGKVDGLECVLRKMGIADGEFTNPGGPGRIHLYKNNGAVLDGHTPAESALTGSDGNPANALGNYDAVLFACMGQNNTRQATARTNVVNYANGGGRVFATHFSYSWLSSTTPFSSTADWHVDTDASLGLDTYTATLDTATVRGLAFQRWLGVVLGVNPPPTTVGITDARFDVRGTRGASQRYIYGPRRVGRTTQQYTQHYTFNTPVNPTSAQVQCGRVVYSDLHVNSQSSTTDVQFPSECDNNAMSVQEKLLEFMLFDLASCIQPDSPPPPPSCTPRTCAQAGANCGPIGDGCGGIISTCGMCTAPQTCGGGGTSSVCGTHSCTPLTGPQACGGKNVFCGPASDGCGGTVDCGSCPQGQTCGGGGQPGVCGAPSCTALTKAQACDAKGFDCGVQPDGCGGTVNCGSGGGRSCAPPQTCGANGRPNVCGIGDAGACAPSTCAAQGIVCGPASDGCGTLIASCGTCPPGQICGGGGHPGVCGAPSCTPLNKAQACDAKQINCGPTSDGCGGTVDCGGCVSPQTCGGGGTPGVCGQPNCTPFQCQPGVHCGPTADGCGGIVDCGGCVLPATCGGGGQPGYCGTPVIH